MTTKISIFSYSDYKSYLRAIAGPSSKRLGVKSALAQALKIQPTYISQVIHGNAHLSLEQAETLSSYWGHSASEKNFFLLLVQKDRAGTHSLKIFFQDQIDAQLKKQMDVSQRLGIQNELSEEDRGVYYSSWHYAAIHVACTIPRLSSKDAIAKHLRIRISRVTEVLVFLVRTGLVKEEEGEFKIGENIIRIGKDSPHLHRHHSNWRERAIDSLDQEELGDLHYSAVISLSIKDVFQIKNRIMENVQENIEVIKKSKEEELYCYTIDFFNLKR